MKNRLVESFSEFKKRKINESKQEVNEENHRGADGTKTDITDYDIRELYSIVYNDEGLYTMRHNLDELYGILDSNYIFTEAQWLEVVDAVESEDESESESSISEKIKQELIEYFENNDTRIDILYYDYQNKNITDEKTDNTVLLISDVMLEDMYGRGDKINGHEFNELTDDEYREYVKSEIKYNLPSVTTVEEIERRMMG